MAGRRREKKDLQKLKKEAEEVIVYLQWDAVSHQKIQELLDKTAAEVEAELKELLSFQHQDTEIKESVLLDEYVCVFWWAKSKSFSVTQISFTLAVLHMLLENIKEKQMDIVDNMMEFVKALAPACYCSQSVEGATPLLGKQESAAFVIYVKESFFHKYRLYQTLFSTSREQVSIGMERTIEVFPSKNGITPLEEGTTFEDPGDPVAGDACMANMTF
ncbi:ciliary-associated calcium-binding coiled-coil protein 1 isoform 1-T14 [Synchiropus picturatus]